MSFFYWSISFMYKITRKLYFLMQFLMLYFQLVAKHFKQINVVEKEVITFFIYTAKNYKNRLDKHHPDSSIWKSDSSQTKLSLQSTYVMNCFFCLSISLLSLICYNFIVCFKCYICKWVGKTSWACFVTHFLF